MKDFHSRTEPAKQTSLNSHKEPPMRRLQKLPVGNSAYPLEKHSQKEMHAHLS